MEYNNSRISKNIRMLRIKNNLTINELADYIGVAPSFMGLIERGDRRIGVDKLLKLCSFFKIPFETLMSLDINFSEVAVAREKEERGELNSGDLRSKIEDFLEDATKEELALALNVLKDIKTLSKMVHDESIEEDIEYQDKQSDDIENNDHRY